jgi:aspartate kinase
LAGGIYDNDAGPEPQQRLFRRTPYICGMKIFKFGGASVNSVERIRQIPAILRPFAGENLLIVISAMGKTTNALEKVAEAFYNGRRDEALHLFGQIKDSHLTTANIS